MKKIFLSSSFSDVAKLLPDFIGSDLKGKSITFIPTAALNEKINLVTPHLQTLRFCTRKLS